MFAARREHVVQVIEPALARGDCVLCDRFTDATYAYQGGGHGVSLATDRRARATACIARLQSRPDAAVRRSAATCRASGSSGCTRRASALDKFEREAPAFFERVRDALPRARGARSRARFRIIDATRPLADVRAELARIVDAL